MRRGQRCLSRKKCRHLLLVYWFRFSLSSRAIQSVRETRSEASNLPSTKEVSASTVLVQIFTLLSGYTECKRDEVRGLELAFHERSVGIFSIGSDFHSPLELYKSVREKGAVIVLLQPLMSQVSEANIIGICCFGHTNEARPAAFCTSLHLVTALPL